MYGFAYKTAYKKSEFLPTNNIYAMKVHYYLCRPNQDGEMTIVLHATIKRQRLRYNTGLKVLPSEWDSASQRVKSKDKALAYNEVLNMCATIATDYANKLGNGKTATQDSFSKMLDIRLGKVDAVDDSFFGFIEQFCRDAVKRTNGNGEFVKAKTIQKYCLLLATLKDFEACKRKNDHSFRLNFASFSQRIVKQYETFLTDEKHFAVNTIGRYLQNLRLVLGEAERSGHTVSPDWKSIRARKEKVENIVLSEDELDKLAALDLSKNERLRNVRDMFLIAAYTGFRHSDVNQLSNEHINRDKGIIRIHQLKTGGLVEVPLHSNLRKVLEQRNYVLPRAISSTCYNRYIKECCFLAGIDEPVEMKKTIGGQRVLTVYKKWQLVSSHTARRSFATNLYLRGVDTELIMAFTGHISQDSFYRYICLTPSQRAGMLKKIWDSSLEQ